MTSLTDWTLRPLTLTAALICCTLLSACAEDGGSNTPSDDAVLILPTDTSPDSSADSADATTTSSDITSDGSDTDTTACEPVTCEQMNVSCGRILNGCGGVLSCGTCRSDEDCLDNACVFVGCRPTECAIEGAFCDSIPDGCGEPLDCGDCDPGFNCTSSRRCIQAPDPVCGNGTVEFGEGCDNAVNNSNFQPDACRRNCQLPFCGDGVTDSNEACDDGNTVESDACQSDCTRPLHCQPCSNDSACGGGRCLSQLNNACAMSCDAALGASACPAGYSCQSVSGGTSCMPTGNTCQEICNNGFDDDGDNRSDCADTDCQSQTYCGATELFCNDGVDNDGDNRLDCLDSDCAATPACACADVSCDVPPAGVCQGADVLQGFLPGTCNTSGGSPQCSYPSATITCNTPPAPTCNPGNDSFTSYSDGGSDCSSGACRYTSTTVQCNTPTSDRCSADNSGIITSSDGSADCAGGACTYASTTTPCNTPPIATCSGSVATIYAATGTCAASGAGVQCTYTSTTQNCAATGLTCGPTGCALQNVPVVAAVDYPVIALGGKLILTGNNFTGANSVTIGGVAQPNFTVSSNTSLTINLVSDSTPLGTQLVVVNTPSSPGTGFNVKVIRLVINELDCDQPKEGPNEDKYEFIEIATGLSESVNLSGYVLIPVNGSGDVTYSLNGFDGQLGTTSSNGLLLLGTSEVSPVPTFFFSRNNLQNGKDAVAIYQRAAAPANDTPVTSITGNIIDALVYSQKDESGDTELLDALIGPNGTPGRSQASEGGSNNTNSIKRCGNNRRDGGVFSNTSSKTPGTPNPCP
jgi:cysteine-rich repeat protein